MDKERWVWVFGWVLLDSFLKRLRLLLRRGARHNKLCEESDVYPHLVFQRGGAQEVSIPLSFALLPHFSFRMQCPKQVHKTQKVFGRRVIRARHLQPFFKYARRKRETPKDPGNFCASVTLRHFVRAFGQSRLARTGSRCNSGLDSGFNQSWLLPSPWTMEITQTM